MKKLPELKILIELIILIWLLTLLLGVTFFSTWEDRGQFGDLFGSINALFSGLAFIGIIFTANLQRIEMDETRKEMISQAEARENMHCVSIGQIRVNALQAQIEALKLLAESRTPDCRMREIDDIKSIAKDIKKIADDLELESNTEYQHLEEEKRISGKEHKEFCEEQDRKKKALA